MEVSDVLRDRMQPPAGLQRMITVSVAVHAFVAAGVLFAPGGLFTRADEPRPVMTISLGGSEGTRNGGITAMGGRPVQVATPDEPPKREAIRPPAQKTPEMTVPLPNAKPTKASKTPSPAVKEAPTDARGRTPTKGAQEIKGATVSDTAVRGMGFGLSTGGGPGSGSTLDVADFCCPAYISTMLDRIRSAWVRNQNNATGESIVKFTIQRDGSLTGTVVERPSGNITLDLAAQRAILLTRTLPPLPAEFPNPTLTVHLSFRYEQ